MALKRSPSMASDIFPPCSSVKLCAMERPSPFPSVERELSPRTKRSINSSAGMFSAAREVFLKVTTASPPVFSSVR